MHEQLHTRKEKTPEERVAQVRRIASKLLERAAALPGATSPEGSVVDGSRIVVDRSDAIADILTINDGNDSLRIEDENGIDMRGHRVTVDKQRRYEFGQTTTARVNANEADGGYMGGTYFEEKIQGGKWVNGGKPLAEKHVDSVAAKTLMEARGKIAAHEIAQKQTTDSEISKLF